MKILITNDDGAGATVLPDLIRWCRKLGEVTVVVPKYEQSGKSHSLELHKPYEAVQTELEPSMPLWTVDSSPADCVRFAVFVLQEKFDLCISGINRGLNLGADLAYSGTFNAACEAVMQGILALAISAPTGYVNQSWTHLDRLFRYIEEKKLLEHCPIYNINIPKEPNRIRITRQAGPYYGNDYVPAGPNLYQAVAKPVYERTGNLELDIDATLGGDISITPITFERTDLSVFRKLREE